ncbi:MULTISPECIES: dihydrolipoyl dehydrogenase family protein [unclassified Clostridioides]|uniref:dihydrolipoyl dehydrogenase family protein n=1 Tax=unclassified Clostridioides TaxID=2635829 RepID=UPI001D11E2E2|nr:NAD(P)/FAD-dependent oxidoreductase [Clostridioides sp. ZZV14-6150]MCC0661594.1 NAD(P)/FAD-dependent oxidoreductase [Clostridioides sp. ZZV14-6154]MCC0668967.1 NAD(P)/FAD-dependent oxidoreductase [Clostridioides sp. ZZV14-6153]MCC0718217.1 NAD(P)/FAD-dependent oxidoreductase [Clostridioides sp. ZZV14-6105]MCC0721558.1 NAD(P)/FAD-dependent oxidoreductase [Clostridioides sp. ZZV14-6104]MCC0728135.1 NAD(P)/FAD-dependent oxidoreductase [Clostridioides sp. ZZV14-6045]MCC0731958.1 NAD(P)/FAD-dep
MKKTFDAIIIGFGKGGKTLAGDLANRGLKVALVEKSNKMYGGTCINVACIPTKSLENSANNIRNINSWSDAQIEYEKAIDKKEILITKLREANYNKLNSNDNVTIFTGMGTFIDENTVEVKTENEVYELVSDKIFINTGSKSFIPNIKGIENNKIVYNSESLMNLRTLPKKMTIIGAGFIGLEFAGIYSSFGTEVTILNSNNGILPNEDIEDSEEIIKLLEKRNVKIINNTKVKEIKEVSNLATVEYEINSELKEITSDIILVATGRKANTEGLGLENAGIELNERGFIKVSDTLKTNKEHIWAIGDINGGPQFTYISLDDYRIIINQLFGNKTRTTSNRKNIPNAIFISPAFSRVGLNVKQAKEKGYDVLVAKIPVDAIPRAKQIGKTDGFIKIVIDKNSNKILGASMICEDSSEIIHLIQLAVDLEVEYTYLRDRVYAHPTMTEALNDVLSPNMIKEV